MLSCRYRFQAYAKNVRQKTTKWSSKTTEVLLDTGGHVLTKFDKFDIYESTIVPNCCKNHTNS